MLHHLPVGPPNYAASPPSGSSKLCCITSQSVLQTMQHTSKLVLQTMLHHLQTMSHYLPETFVAHIHFTSTSTSNFTEDKILFGVTSALCHNHLQVGEPVAVSAVSDLPVGNMSNHTQSVDLNFNVFHIWG